MSLNFNFSKCVNSDELNTDPCDPKKINPVTEAMIWNMMSIDMGEITKANVDEVWFRTALISLTRDTCAAMYANNNGEPDAELVRIYLTRADVERHIGLSTNVSTLTRMQWLKKTYGNEKHSIDWLHTRSQKRSALQMVADRAAELKAKEPA